MVGRTMKMLLVALVAAFALSSIAEAAPRPVRHRATAKKSATAGATAVHKKTVKRTVHKRAATTHATAKRRPSTKPR